METINATGQLHDAIVEEFSAMVPNATILWDGLYTMEAQHRPRGSHASFELVAR